MVGQPFADVRVVFSVHKLSPHAAANVNLRIKVVEVCLCLADQRMFFRIGRNQVALADDSEFTSTNSVVILGLSSLCPLRIHLCQKQMEA